MSGTETNDIHVPNDLFITHDHVRVPREVNIDLYEMIYSSHRFRVVKKQIFIRNCVKRWIKSDM